MGVILVTGASRGIGRGIALELARGGHTVAVHYNGNRDAARATADECTALARSFAAAAEADAAGPGPNDAGLRAEIFQADISVAGQRRRLVDEVIAAYGSIDGLVNNAGIAPRKRDDIVFAEEEIFDEVMRVNLHGPYFLTQEIARRWLESGAGAGDASAGASGASAGLAPGGSVDAASAAPTPAPPAPRRIVFVTSVSAVMVSTSRGEYCVSKAGLSMAASLFAARLAPHGILVCEVRPGITRTDMTAGVTGKYDRLIAEGLVPQGRWGYPEDTGKVVRSILDGNLDFCAGSVIYTDGGLTIPRL